MTVTKDELFLSQAPLFNFELDADELLAKALEAGFVTEVGNDRYHINDSYAGSDADAPEKV